MFVSNDAQELLKHQRETVADMTKRVHLEVMTIFQLIHLRIFFHFNPSQFEAFDILSFLQL